MRLGNPEAVQWDEGDRSRNDGIQGYIKDKHVKGQGRHVTGGEGKCISFPPGEGIPPKVVMACRKGRVGRQGRQGGKVGRKHVCYPGQGEELSHRSLHSTIYRSLQSPIPTVTICGQ